MNERIKECWIKAAREDASETWDSQEQFIERFAEVIVKECIDIIAPYSVRMSRPGEEYPHPIQEIKQHFGVEE